LVLSACATDKPWTTPPLPIAKNEDNLVTTAVTGMVTTVIANDKNACRLFKGGVTSSSSDEFYLDLAAVYVRPTNIPDGFYSYPTDYDSQTRTLLERVFVSKQSLATLTATVSFGGAKVSTIPLFSSQHNSDTDKGEAFSESQQIWNSGVVVRVDRSKTLKIEFTPNYATTIEHMSVITSGLEIAKVGISTFVPGAHFLSDLDKPSLEKQSKLYDAALGRSVGKTMADTPSLEIRPSDIPNESCGAIRFTIPGTPSLIGQNLDPKIIVGDWYFGVLDSSHSLFISEDVIKAANLGTSKDKGLELPKYNPYVSPQHVLDEPVGGEPPKSLGKFVLADSAVTGALSDWKTAISAKTDTDKAVAADAFCKGVISALHGIGLTPIDAKLGLWAILQGTTLPGKPQATDVKQLATACAADLMPIIVPENVTKVAETPADKPVAKKSAANRVPKVASNQPQ